MRKLKFRAWSNEHNRYCDFVTLDENGRWIGWIKSNGVYLTTLDIVLEQDTGLKDKNGKEIYGGDICRLVYYERGGGRKRWKKVNEDIELVEFEDGYFKFSNTDQYGIDSELSFSDYGEWATADGQYKYEAEVIGSVHENPELLGGEE